jgi:bla regulator protein BlaR1
MERFVLECAIRAALIAIVTAALLAMMRIKTASARHAAWTGVMLSMLLLPLWTAWGPKTYLRVLPAAALQHGTRQITDTLSPVSTPADAGHHAVTERKPAWNWGDLWLAFYLTGALTLLLRLAIGTARAHILVRGATNRAGRLTSASCEAPVTVGWLRPAVILPKCWQRWTAAQLDAVMLHENAHARRRDPLVQWLALLNRALFWYHPLAWWLERRLSVLAEEACDAAVLERGHDPRDYSEYLLDIARTVAQTGGRINVWGMAMPGSSLAQRIRMIVDSQPVPRISRMRLICAAAACLAASCFLASVTVLAQTQTAPAANAPAFEVASVKQNKTGGMGASARGGSTSLSPAEITMQNCTLWKIIGLAYGFGEDKDYALTGPDWIKSERYDIVAKFPADMPKDRTQMVDRVQLMLRTLLAERFKLVVHHEPKVLSAYALVVGKNGSKMAQAGDGHRMNIGPASMTGQTPMAHFADLLSQKLDRPVVDLTDLKGVFEVKLEWSPDVNPPDVISNKATEPAPDNGTKPSIFTAIQEQLGLRLEARKLPVDVLVVDRAEKVPTEN